ncbi:E3 ubiquitin-protein ligase RNF26-like [Acanthaster planci]|uniref:E3 ubiquitin-protein ligase RNF26-like n=1 Tax=Acanthaster planci TaxID=133434 RepID=A0A8B7Z865_ACAPL|nr:E3 ubiquitin-protein ligase RNF26-like [Acanthaster planci]XP_022100991.1 E3 ubiquitin-protein ligase RNF26-like [Acanthaster planci]
MALSDVIASISHWVSNVLWLCSQPLYLVQDIYETNYEVMSAVFSTIYYCLLYTAKAGQLLMFGVLSVVETIIDLLGNLQYVIRVSVSGLITVFKFGVQMSLVIFQTTVNYGLWIISKVWYGAVWSYTSLGYCISVVVDAVVAVLPTLVEFQKGTGALLHYVVVSFGHFLTMAVLTVSGTLAWTLSSALTWMVGALTAVCRSILQWFDDLWEMMTCAEISLATARAYSTRKFEELYFGVLEASSNAFGSFVSHLFVFLSTVSYIMLFAVCCLVLVLVPMKFYGLYMNALSSAHTMVRLLHQALFGSEHAGQQNREHRPPQVTRNVEQQLPAEGDASDTDGDNSLLSSIRPRRVAPAAPPQHTPPANPQQVPQSSGGSSAANRPGPSGKHAQQIRPTPPSAPSLSAPKSNKASLARQLEEERDRQLCVVCQDNGKNILILPCKHLCVCLECVEEITGQQRRDARKCPLCRQAIRSYLEVYT